jgi:Icc protein
LRIVQITDTHLKARPGLRTRGVDPCETLRAVLAAVAKVEPALVVVTGDLATERSLSTYRLLRNLLTGLDARVLPGNHDRRDFLREAFDLPQTSRTVNFVETIGSFRLVGLDTLRPWRIHGRLGEDQLDWLESELRVEMPTILFMHHPPVPVGTWWLDRDVVREADRLRGLVERGAVRAICCGHVHQEHHARFGGADVWTTPSTAYQFVPHATWPSRIEPSRPGFRVIDLDGATLETHVART